MVFCDLADCHTQCAQAGSEWDLSDLSVSAQELLWLAAALANPLVLLVVY
jgi:hypothetical protein